MSDEIIAELLCPNCTNVIELAAQHPDKIQCPTCEHQFLLTDHMCPVCFTYHAEKTVVCHACGKALNRLCRHCHTTNWSGDEICQNCGQHIDLITQISDYTQARPGSRLHEDSETIRKIKEQEQKASEERMAELLEIEKQRREEIYRRMAAQQKRERQLLLGTVFVIGLLLLTAVAYILFTSINP
ncbi:MAG: hypothetical protein D6706_04215 [Chloroflexi bacterium]|nr:MAG: hypothetical protein D6706_04215 [Chloroflexota bacterium]